MSKKDFGIHSEGEWPVIQRLRDAQEEEAPHAGVSAVIPDEAIDAALGKLGQAPLVREFMRAALEAATPHLLGRVQVGSFELIAPDVTRIGDTISYGGHLYVRDTP